MWDGGERVAARRERGADGGEMFGFKKTMKASKDRIASSSRQDSKLVGFFVAGDAGYQYG